jgi:hypothetical protein
VFLGSFAGADTTSGTNNIAMGDNALRYATTGGRNIAIGQGAMGLGVATTTFGSNVAIGYRAGYDITTGDNNALLGTNAGVSITSGTGNVLFGDGAGATVTTGSRNVFIGENAGGEEATTTTSSVIVGASAGSEATGDNIILLGSGADPSVDTATNEITLGNNFISRFRIPGCGIDNTSAALSGTTPSVDVGDRDTYTLTTSGNTTFTFTGAPSSGQVGTFSLIITAGGTHTLTWPASVDWAGGTAPDAPASGEKDIYTFMTVDGGTTWYGFLAGDAMA